MKSILQSIKPKWVAKILNGEKTIEVRKTAPKDWMDYLSGKTKVKPEPSAVYIYCTKDREILTDNGYGKFYVTDDDETKSSIKLFGYSLNGKVIAKYTLREVERILWNYRSSYTTATLTYEELERASQLNFAELYMYARRTKATETEYLGNKAIILESFDRRIFACHISDLEIFDEPRELGEFGLTKAPQSWCYVEAIE